MKRMVLDLVPHEPAVFSKVAATAGGHATHIAPTGAALLGWAAGKLWTTFGDTRAPDIFLSGKVRFSDAIHVADGKAFFAQPAILLAPKHGGGDPCLGRAAFEAKYNPDPAKLKVQADRLSLGLFAIDGHYRARPALAQRLRTATEAGRAKRGSLFGYQAVTPSGATLRATIEADERDVSDSEWEALEKAFAGRMFLGRAAANGYGGAYDCTRSDEKSPWPNGFEGKAERLRIWFLTDAALADKWGNPHTRPGPADFGLDASWVVQGSETAVTTRRVWPWNRVLGCRETEAGVVEAGSVVTLRRAGGPAEVKVPAIVGQHQERGWGRIAVMPEEFPVVHLDGSNGGARGEATSASGLVDWARKKADEAEATARSDVTADQLVREIVGLVRQLGADGPPPAQWSRVEDAARGRITADKAFQQDEWKKLVDTGSETFPSIGSWVREKLLDAGIPLPAMLRVIQAARAEAQKVRQ